jgi:hypothetical protein
MSVARKPRMEASEYSDVSSSTGVFQVPTFARAGEVVEFASPEQSVPDKARVQALEAAVFTHMQALRALGRTSISAAEVARALHLTVSEVETIVRRLVNRGVRIAT